MERHAGQVYVSKRLLIEALSWPADISLKGVEYDPLTDSVRFVLEHPRLPECPEGTGAPFVDSDEIWKLKYRAMPS
jgi:hypothetical protein